jgi:hypothetical protein
MDIIIGLFCLLLLCFTVLLSFSLTFSLPYKKRRNLNKNNDPFHYLFDVYGD